MNKQSCYQLGLCSDNKTLTFSNCNLKTKLYVEGNVNNGKKADHQHNDENFRINNFYLGQ